MSENMSSNHLKKQFELLKEKIKDTRQTSADIKQLLDTLDEREISEDELMNVLIGVEHLITFRADTLTKIVETIEKSQNEEND